MFPKFSELRSLNGQYLYTSPFCRVQLSQNLDINPRFVQIKVLPEASYLYNQILVLYLECLFNEKQGCDLFQLKCGESFPPVKPTIRIPVPKNHPSLIQPIGENSFQIYCHQFQVLEAVCASIFSPHGLCFQFGYQTSPGFLLISLFITQTYSSSSQKNFHPWHG